MSIILAFNGHCNIDACNRSLLRTSATTMEPSQPSETSPLLAKPVSVLPDPGDAPAGILPNGVDINAEANGSSKPGNDQESQSQDDQGDRKGQYQGMPEIKKKLKYILPAMSIGVCASHFIYSNGCSFPRRSF